MESWPLLTHRRGRSTTIAGRGAIRSGRECAVSSFGVVVEYAAPSLAASVTRARAALLPPVSHHSTGGATARVPDVEWPRYALVVSADDDKTWDERVFDQIDPGVDPTIIRENLKLSPTERIEKMQRMLSLVHDLRKAHGNRSSRGPESAR